jgi:hypothetical protein
MFLPHETDAIGLLKIGAAKVSGSAISNAAREPSFATYLARQLSDFPPNLSAG